ncbi:MAG: hypothetical protein IT204_02945 [Fimbriimonadaceae bacterium]|nr:hypothetical protein [Fimbriimonadaceae bacterium]
MAGRTLHVISHSHWDREWYMPFELHRRRLVKLLDDLLEVIDRDPEFGSFHLDGQTIPLDDYLAVRPQQRARLQAAAQAGRLTVGPHYILQDEFLTSAEAQARNLLYGLRHAAEFGEPLRVGYLADSFGHIGQMPALLRGFGIDNAVFGRGVNRLNPQASPDAPLSERGYPSELCWEGSDGSQVLGIFMANWYANAMDIPSDQAACVARFEAIRDAALRYATTPHLLLMNGCDHTPCQLHISTLIGQAREALDDVVVHSRLDDYVRAVQATVIDLELARGELRSEYTDGWGTLTNVLSSRLYLKQANTRCQDLLEKHLEPLQAVDFALGGGIDRDFRAYLWKLLLQNHPHDSICGCSCDQVHQEMETRFAKVEQLADQLAKESFERLAGRVDTSALPADAVAVVVYNPLGTARREVVEVEVSFEQGVEVDEVAVCDAAGAPVPATVKEDHGLVWDYALPDDRFRVPFHCRRLTVELLADVPACGYATYQIAPSSAAPPPEPEVGDVIENEWLRVERCDGYTVNLLDKRTGRTWEGLNLLLLGGDEGDEYNYRQPADDALVGLEPETCGHHHDDEECDHQHGEVALAWSNPLSAGWALTGSFVREGADEHDVQQIGATVWLALPTHSPRLDVQVVLENYNATDFRLRAHFPTDTATGVVQADGHFEVVERAITPWSGWTNPSNCQPCQQFVDLSDERGGLTVAVRGLPEYEVLRDGRNTLALTLLRGTGEIGDWGVFPTPEAQCQGTQLADYSLLPHPGALAAEGVDALARGFALPLTARQTDRHPGELPPRGSWVALQPSTLVLSALRVAEDRDELIVRFYNPYATPVEATVQCGLPVTAVHRCNLNEEPAAALPLVAGAVRLAVGAKEIVSLALRC